MIPAFGLRNGRMEREVHAQEAFPTVGLRGEEARGQTPSTSDQGLEAGLTGGRSREAKEEQPVAWEESAVLSQGQVEKAVLAGSMGTECFWWVKRENRPWIGHPGSS